MLFYINILFYILKCLVMCISFPVYTTVGILDYNSRFRRTRFCYRAYCPARYFPACSCYCTLLASVGFGPARVTKNYTTVTLLQLHTAAIHRKRIEFEF